MAYLVHHGIKGQEWGVRRFQNSDGSLTSAGHQRYVEDPGNKFSWGESAKNVAKKVSSKVKEFYKKKKEERDRANARLSDSEKRKKRVKKVVAAVAAASVVAALAYAASKNHRERSMALLNKHFNDMPSKPSFDLIASKDAKDRLRDNMDRYGVKSAGRAMSMREYYRLHGDFKHH